MPFEPREFDQEDKSDDLFLFHVSTLEVLVRNGTITNQERQDIFDNNIPIPLNDVVFPPFPNPDRPGGPGSVSAEPATASQIERVKTVEKEIKKLEKQTKSRWKFW